MSSEILPGKIPAAYETTGKMGGDMPGMVAHEVPLLAQSLLEHIEEEQRAGLIPPDKDCGVIVVGPITKPDGTKVTLIFRVEYDKSDL